jgi:nucleoside-diphosphate-sugar epimerase
VTTVLVAGGAGLLGSALARYLLRQSNSVVVADVFDASGDTRAVKEERAARFEAHPRATLLTADLSEEKQVEGVFASHRPAIVVNAARFDPAGPGATALMTVSRAWGTGLFVHLSDGALYGPPAEPGRRAREDEAVDPGEDPWLRARAADEAKLLESGLPFIVLRIFDLVGPSLPRTRFAANVLEAIVAGEEVFLPDGEPRDFLHLEDAVRGIALALRKRPIGEIINLGSGTPVSPRLFLERLAARAGKPLRLTIVPSSTTPPRTPRIADLEKAWNLLGFAPERALEDIVDEMFHARFSSGAVARDFPRLLRRNVQAPPPREVSRRELFDLFRRPFGRR